MKLELKPFQENAAREIICELDEARVSFDKGKLKAVILSAPTGSGKTITLAQVIDLRLVEATAFQPDPRPRFYGSPILQS